MRDVRDVCRTDIHSPESCIASCIETDDSDARAYVARAQCCARSRIARLHGGCEQRQYGEASKSIRTLILSYIFQGKGQTGVLSLNDADLAECASANDTVELELVKGDCFCHVIGSSLHSTWLLPREHDSPSPGFVEGFP